MHAANADVTKNRMQKVMTFVSSTDVHTLFLASALQELRLDNHRQTDRLTDRRVNPPPSPYFLKLSYKQIPSSSIPPFPPPPPPPAQKSRKTATATKTNKTKNCCLFLCPPPPHPRCFLQGTQQTVTSQDRRVQKVMTFVSSTGVHKQFLVSTRQELHLDNHGQTDRQTDR